MRSFKKTIKTLVVKVDVSKGVLKVRIFFENRCASFIQFMFHPLLSHGDDPK